METTTPREERRAAPEDMSALLSRRGHCISSWDALGKLPLPSGAVASVYRVGISGDEHAPTVFKMYFPPGCTIEAHTHACNYTEIVLEGSQKVGADWLRPGDIRVGLANKGYGPLVAGPDGATVLVIFANSRWEGIPFKDGGSTLGTPEITDRLARER